MGVDIARRQFLARPGRSGQHHPAIGLRDLFQLPQKRAKGGRVAQHLGGGDLAPLERLILAAQATGFHAAPDHHHQLVDIEGLFNEVIGALLDRRDGDLDIAMPRDDHHRHIGVVALDRLEDVDAVHPAVLEPDIENEKAGLFGANGHHGLVGIAREPRRIALIPENIRNQFADVALVIDNQNITHGFPSLGRAGLTSRFGH